MAFVRDLGYHRVKLGKLNYPDNVMLRLMFNLTTKPINFPVACSAFRCCLVVSSVWTKWTKGYRISGLRSELRQSRSPNMKSRIKEGKIRWWLVAKSKAMSLYGVKQRWVEVFLILLHRWGGFSTLSLPFSGYYAHNCKIEDCSIRNMSSGYRKDLMTVPFLFSKPDE